jgi:hypothetical protein
MAIKINYPDGTSEIIPEAKGAHDNYAQGTFDFKDEQGRILKQTEMDEGITWEPVPEPEDNHPDGS